LDFIKLFHFNNNAGNIQLVATSIKDNKIIRFLHQEAQLSSTILYDWREGVAVLKAFAGVICIQDLTVHMEHLNLDYCTINCKVSR